MATRSSSAVSPRARPSRMAVAVGSSANSSRTRASSCWAMTAWSGPGAPSTSSTGRSADWERTDRPRAPVPSTRCQCSLLMLRMTPARKATMATPSGTWRLPTIIRVSASCMRSSHVTSGGKPLAYQRASVFRRSSSRSVTRPSPSADSLGRTILGSVSGGKWRIRTTSSREYAHFQASRGHVLRNSEHYLPVGDVDPPLVLEADLAKRRYALEAQLFVQAHARFVRQGSAADGDVYAPCSEEGEQLGIKARSEPTPLAALFEVDGRFDRVAVGAADLPLAGIGIAEHAALELGYQPGQIGTLDFSQPGRHDLRRHGFFLERDDGIFDVVVVDTRKGMRVGGRCRAYGNGGHTRRPRESITGSPSSLLKLPC